MPDLDLAAMPSTARDRGNGVKHDSTPFDRKLDEILRQAAAVFCVRGYHKASIRDIARATGVSLAGLYYYFSSKEELLYLIQRHAFRTILTEARAALEPLRDPEKRLRTFVRLHLQFFIRHPNEMTVLTHEDGSLEDRWRHEVHAVKKAYYRLGYDQVEALKHTWKLKGQNTRVAVLSLFGMMNWIYTWYRPKVDPHAEALAEQMTEIFLRGIGGARPRRGNGVGVFAPPPEGESHRKGGAKGNGTRGRPQG